MAGALREILASFGVEFDKEGNLAKGDKQIDGLTEKLTSFGKYVAGAFAVDQVYEFGKGLILAADHLGETAERLNVNTQALQQWRYAAKLNGVEADELTASIQRLGAGLAEAAQGKGQAAAFKKLGVDLKNSDDTLKSSIQIFEEAGLAIGALEDPTEAAGLAADLFGKQYAKLMPLFKQGPEGLAALKKEFEELGGGFSPEFIKQSEELNDDLDRLSFGFKGLAVQLLGPVLSGLAKLTQMAVGVTRSFVTWIKQTTAVRAVLTALSVRGVMALVSGVPKLIAHFGGLGAILARVALFAAKVVAPFLILDDLIGFLSGDDSALGAGLEKAFGPGTAENVRSLIFELVKFFGLFKTEPDNVRKSFAKLPEDLEKDLGGFGSFLGGWGQNIVEVGLFAANALTGGWQNFVTKAKAAGDGFMLALKIVWTEIKFAGLAAAAAMSDAFDGVWNSIISGAQDALSALLDVLAKLPGTEDAVRSLRAKVASLDSAKGSADAGEFVRKDRDKARLAIAAEGDRIGAIATAPASAAPVTNNNVQNTIAPVTNVQVTVEGSGGDAAVGNRIGKAAGKVAGDTSLRAVKAALVPTPG